MCTVPVVGLLVKLTVYGPARSKRGLSEAVGAGPAPPFQFSGSLNAPPAGFDQMTVAAPARDADRSAATAKRNRRRRCCCFTPKTPRCVVVSRYARAARP